MLLAMKTRNQLFVRFHPSVVTVKQSSIVSQIVSSLFSSHSLVVSFDVGSYEDWSSNRSVCVGFR